MSRINVEDSIWCDPRAKACVRILGEFRAMGAILVLWRVAQGYWCKGGARAPIPKEIYESYGFPEELLRFGLVFKSEQGDYFASGSKKHFDWRIEHMEAAIKGGKKSAQNRLEKYGSAQPTKPRSEPEVLLQEPRSSTSGISKSPTPTPTPTLIHNTICAVSEKTALVTLDIKSEVEAIYKLYPKRGALGTNKGGGISKICKQLETDRDVRLFKQAVENYAAECDSFKKTGTELVMMFSTFCGPKDQRWREYIRNDQEEGETLTAEQRELQEIYTPEFLKWRNEAHAEFAEKRKKRKEEEAAQKNMTVQ